MDYFRANCFKKGQLKIQQMAFVLVALMIFFGIVMTIFFSVRIADLRDSASSLGEDEAKEIVRKMTSTPEFSFDLDGCAGCIDMDKVLILKDRMSYKNFWNIDFLKIERVYPKYEGECSRLNYPECGEITLIEKEDIGTPSQAFVTLCRWEESKGGYVRCDIGKIYASGGMAKDDK